MARAPTTSDVFNAIAEPRRRDILSYLADTERSVLDIVDAMALPQPSVSKHLKVLRDVGLVDARRDGRQMFYRTNAHAVKPLYEWSRTFERHWRRQLTAIKQRAEARSATKDEHTGKRRNNGSDDTRD
jgi:DNA-binding transcriptional ArsR family regulator